MGCDKEKLSNSVTNTVLFFKPTSDVKTTETTKEVPLLKDAIKQYFESSQETTPSKNTPTK